MMNAGLPALESSKTVKSRRRPGRPVDRANRGALRRLEIWLYVETLQARYFEVYGHRQTVSAITRLIEANGGILRAIGGDHVEILRAIEKNPGRRALRAMRPKRNRKSNGNAGINSGKTREIIVKEVTRSKQSIRVRYYEAKLILARDQRLRLHYENLLAERLGRPLPHARSAITVPFGGR